MTRASRLNPAVRQVDGDQRYATVAQTVTASKLRAASLLTRLATAETNPFASLSSDAPTVSVGTSATVSGRNIGLQSGLVTEVCSRGTYVSSFSYINNLGQLSGLDFFLTGTTVEIRFVSNTTGVQPFWLFIDGKPMTASPDTTTLATTGGATYYLKLTFGSSARRRIEIFTSGITAWHTVLVDNATLVTPAPRKPVVAFVGDSFWGGSGAAPLLNSGAFIMSRMLGVECVNLAYGGTGYVAVGSFQIYGSSTRTNFAQRAACELVIFSGSVNDDGTAGSTVGAAAAAAYIAFAAVLPTAPFIVFGPQPNAAASTIGTARAAVNAAVRTAALAHANVIAFHDQIGTASGTVPAAWSSSTTYNDGDTVTYKGSVWKLVNGGSTNSAATPGTSNKWALVTYALTGTGTTAAPAGDGTRDTYLYSDSVHPTVLGNQAFAVQMAAIVRSDLLAAAA